MLKVHLDQGTSHNTGDTTKNLRHANRVADVRVDRLSMLGRAHIFQWGLQAWSEVTNKHQAYSRA